MSDDLADVRADLQRWQQVNQADAIRAELARRGVEIADASPVDEAYQEVVAEVTRRARRGEELEARLAEIESDPRKALAEAMASIAECLAAIARPPAPAPTVVVKEIERDRDGNIMRIIEQQVPADDD